MNHITNFLERITFGKLVLLLFAVMTILLYIGPSLLGVIFSNPKYLVGIAGCVILAIWLKNSQTAKATATATTTIGATTTDAAKAADAKTGERIVAESKPAILSTQSPMIVVPQNLVVIALVVVVGYFAFFNGNGAAQTISGNAQNQTPALTQSLVAPIPAPTLAPTPAPEETKDKEDAKPSLPSEIMKTVWKYLWDEKSKN